MNDKLCNIICGIGCAISSWCMGMMFFGAITAVWGALIGIVMILFGLFEYK